MRLSCVQKKVYAELMDQSFGSMVMQRSCPTTRAAGVRPAQPQQLAAHGPAGGPGGAAGGATHLLILAGVRQAHVARGGLGDDASGRDQRVGQRRLAVVDVRDDAKVSGALGWDGRDSVDERQLIGRAVRQPPRQQCRRAPSR